jgi:hypothetical protein
MFSSFLFSLLFSLLFFPSSLSVSLCAPFSPLFFSVFPFDHCLCTLFLSGPRRCIIDDDGTAVPLFQGVFIVDNLTVIAVRTALEPPLNGFHLRTQAARVSQLHASLRNVTNTLACQKNLLDELVAADAAAIRAKKNYQSLCRANALSDPRTGSKRR